MELLECGCPALFELIHGLGLLKKTNGHQQNFTLNEKNVTIQLIHSFLSSHNNRCSHCCHSSLEMQDHTKDLAPVIEVLKDTLVKLKETERLHSIALETIAQQTEKLATAMKEPDQQDAIKELETIKEVLKVNQQTLKETEQKQFIAQETIAHLSQKLEIAMIELEMTRAQLDKRENIEHHLELAEKKITALEKENDLLTTHNAVLINLQYEHNKALDEKSQVIQLLLNQVETLQNKESQCKEEAVLTKYRYLQAEIEHLKGELAMPRTAPSCANKEHPKLTSRTKVELRLVADESTSDASITPSSRLFQSDRLY